MTPTLSEIQRWTPDGLTSTADHWNQQADLVERVFTSARNQVNSSSWQGQGSEMARTHYGGNLGAVIAHAAEMRAAAQTASLEASTLSSLKANLMSEVDQARQQQFQVDDNFQVTDGPSFTSTEQFLRKPILLAHQATLTAQRDAFITAEQGAATSLQGHGETLGSFNFPDTKPPYNQWCQREELPADGPGDGGGCLDYGGTDRWPAHDQWGNESPGAFNDDIKVDTSHATMTGRDDPNNRYKPPWSIENSVPHDWPGMPLPLTGQGDSQPFLPSLLTSLGAPTGAAHGSSFKTDTTPDPSPPFLPQYQQDVTTGPPTSPPIGTPLPGTPMPPRPPVMTAMPSDEAWPPNPAPYVAHEPDLEQMLSIGFKGGVGGATAAAIAASEAPPFEPIAVISGGIVGAEMGIATQAVAPFVENALHDLMGED
jgi:hypothetical protein